MCKVRRFQQDGCLKGCRGHCRRPSRDVNRLVPYGAKLLLHPSCAAACPRLMPPFPTCIALNPQIQRHAGTRRTRTPSPLLSLCTSTQMKGNPVPTLFLYSTYFSPKNSTKYFSSPLILLLKNNHSVTTNPTSPTLFPNITCVPTAQ